MTTNGQIESPDGGVLGYAEYGDPTGRPLVYFHGWPSSRYQARLLHETAEEHGVRVISPDRPGLGLSSYRPKRRLLDWPQYVVALCDSLRLGSVSILAVSGGGSYALACAHAIPQRLERLGIVCGAPPLDKLPDRRKMVLLYRVLLNLRRMAPWAMYPFFPLVNALTCQPLDKPPLKWLMRLMPEVDRRALGDPERMKWVMASYREGARNGLKALITDADVYLEDWGFEVESIQMPVHFWHGELDGNIPIAMAKQLASRIPNAVTKWYEEEGHYSLPLEHASEILSDLMQPAEAAGASPAG